MSDRKCALSLVSLAERDIRSLRGIANIASVGDEAAGFFAQQATEKLLKAWIASLGEVFPLTHDLQSMLELVERRVVDASQFRDLVALTPFAVQFRYEFLPEDSEPLDRQKIASRLEALLKRVRAELAAPDSR